MLLVSQNSVLNSYPHRKIWMSYKDNYIHLDFERIEMLLLVSSFVSMKRNETLQSSLRKHTGAQYFLQYCKFVLLHISRMVDLLIIIHVRGGIFKIFKIYLNNLPFWTKMLIWFHWF